ncbi:MAG: 16S rRNA (guanine(527)-N(7))-methyltransferase RsmG [Polyangiales bacterium]
MGQVEPARYEASLERVAAAFGHELGAASRDALLAFVALVERWNAKVNLTGATGPEALCEVLLADAFALCSRELVPEAARVLDVGTGAGAPIVPLLVLRPDLSASCVEPLGKRATFLRTLSARLGLLSRMTVLERRLDLERDAGKQLQDQGAFDVACSRATFGPERWVPLGLALAPRVILLGASAEPPSPPEGARLLHTLRYQLPFSSAPRLCAVYLRG